MELLIALLVCGHRRRRVAFRLSGSIPAAPLGRVLADVLGYGVLPLLFVLLLVYGQVDPTPFVIALAAVGLLWLVFSVP
jgi:hypothetical protein